MPKRTSRFSKRKTSLKSSVDPLAYSQPGVYVEEVSSLPRTIEGVPTSTTAFVGKATSGPFNEPTTLRSFGEFEIEFGGLSLDSFLGYSVKQFFENGGPRAIVVRIGTKQFLARIISMVLELCRTRRVSMRSIRSFFRSTSNPALSFRRRYGCVSSLGGSQLLRTTESVLHSRSTGKLGRCSDCRGRYWNTLARRARM